MALIASIKNNLHLDTQQGTYQGTSFSFVGENYYWIPSASHCFEIHNMGGQVQKENKCIPVSAHIFICICIYFFNHCS